MRVYVAGASREPKRVRRAMDALRARGHEITLDWLAVMEAAPAPDSELSLEQLRPYAQADLEAIEAAHAVWLLAPDAPSTGCWVELGYAIADGCLIYVSGPGARRCIFASLADGVFESDEHALDAFPDLRSGAWEAR